MRMVLSPDSNVSLWLSVMMLPSLSPKCCIAVSSPLYSLVKFSSSTFKQTCIAFFYDILLHHYEVTFSRILVIERLFICPTQMEENRILKTPAQVVSWRIEETSRTACLTAMSLIRISSARAFNIPGCPVFTSLSVSLWPRIFLLAFSWETFSSSKNVRYYSIWWKKMRVKLSVIRNCKINRCQIVKWSGFIDLCRLTLLANESFFLIFITEKIL